jgi:soluble lytic murein transglycosylase-like protein
MRFVLFLIFIVQAISVFAVSDTVNLTNTGKSPAYEKKNPSAFRFDPQYDIFIDKYSTHYSLDPFLIKCIIKVESDFNPKAVSKAGAAGLMQLMQETARDYGVNDRSDPEQNIRAGSAHLSFLMKEFNGEVPLVLAAYHAGSTRVKRSGGIPPIRATIDYVNMVMRYFEGGGDYSGIVKKLYKTIDRDGTIHIGDR